MNLANLVEQGARLCPDQPALHFEGETFSYRQLGEASSRAANGFAGLGIGRGDRVALWLPNTVAFVIAYLGVHKLGAVAVTINTALTAEELGFILNDCGARLFLTTAAMYCALPAAELIAAAPELQHVVLIEGAGEDTEEGAIAFADLLRRGAATFCCAEMASDDPALILYTSGTTGFPKGAVLAHGAAIAAVETAVAAFGIAPGDRVLLPLATFHSFGQTAALLPALAAGATLLLHRQFELQPVLRAIEEQKATVFFGVPTLYILLQSHAAPAQLQSVRRFFSAGAPLPVAVAHQWYTTFKVPIHEGYGLTEIFLGTFNADPISRPGSVGRPLPGVRIRIADATGASARPGEAGEVLIATPSMMLGYWRRPDESAAVLRNGWLHTGDMGCMDEDGYLTIVDRLKDMVNVGGVKVYPSEVEHVLYQHPAVAEAAVYGIPEAVLGEQVQASVVLKAGADVPPQALIAFCRQRLAEFKVPSVVRFVDQLPKNRSGKVLKRLLRDTAQAKEGLLPMAVLPQGAENPPVPTLGEAGHLALPDDRTGAVGQWMATWLADQLDVAVEQIGWAEPFAELGLTSVMAVNFARALGDWLGQPIEAILLWSFPTIDALIRHLQTVPAASATSAPAGSPSHGRAEPIALIGMGCRFPGGARTPEKFWQILYNGIDPVRDIPADRWNVDDYYVAGSRTAGKMYVRAGCFLEDVDQFDPQLLGILSLEAASMDPQQRLLLEVAWEALEHANLPIDALRESRTGVYVGAFWDDYSAANLYNAAAEQIDSYRLLSNLRGMTAGRLAYTLGLHGPAMQVDTACSSSLLAVHLACQALRTGECDLALAGGVSLLLAPEQLLGLCQMGAVSADGRCKSFAAEADGFGIGEGCGMVVLKRLADAVAAGDHILGVIRGSAVNHDGPSNGLTAPNGRAQEALVRQALANADVSPEQIQFVETHGTGTILGDPIEVQALLSVLGQVRTQPLLLGSVKSNIGHLSAAAGVAALIKVVLSLNAGEIPPNLHFTTPNPHISWATAPVAVPVVPTPWPTAERRLAGVSSFGLSGTNVHLIVEAAPSTDRRASTAVVPATPVERPGHLLPLSARSAPALAAQARQLEQWLAAQPMPADPQRWLADICHTAATGRAHWEHRLSIIAPDLATLRARLQQAQAGVSAPGILYGVKDSAAPRVAFLFPGQGPQYAGMGRQLYATQPLFRRTLAQCDEILHAYLDQSLLTLLYGPDSAQADALLNDATYAQPALFALEYALAILWRSWGIEPAVLIGHSLGEYAAACLAGVFSLADGLKLVATRGRLMQVEAPRGQMVAVLGHEAVVREILAPYAHTVALAAINTPQSLVIAGSPEFIQAANCDLRQAGIETRPLKIYVASHSPLMEPILAEFAAVARTVTFHRPSLPVISNVTGELADELLATPDYWCRHLREPVQFAQGMATIAGLGIDTFVEAGPKATLLGLGQQCLSDSAAQHWLRSIHPSTEEWSQMLESLAVLYGYNARVDWQGFEQGYSRAKVTLPGYPFQRQRYWLTESSPQTRRLSPAAAPPGRLQPPAGHPFLGEQVHSVVTARSQEVLYAGQVDLVRLPYLADHTLFEQPVIPGAAFIEMILAAATQLWPQRQFFLAGCSIQQGLFLSEDDPAGESASVTLQTLFTPTATGYQWQIYSRAGDAQPADGWTLHATGSLTECQAAPSQRLPLPVPVDLAALQLRCHTAVDLGDYEQRLQAVGIAYGPCFQSLTDLWLGEDEALGYARLPAALDGTADSYQFHPVLLDAVLRVTSSLLPADESELYLPFGMEQLLLYSQGPHTCLWSHVQRRASAPGSQQVDITLLDATGGVVARCVNFELRRAARQLLRGERQGLDWLYKIAWQPVVRSGHSPFGRSKGRWIILSDRQGYGAGLSAYLEAQGEECFLLDRAALGELVASPALFTGLLQEQQLAGTAGLRGIVYLWGLNTTVTADDEVPSLALQLSTEVLHLVQALLKEEHAPRLWLVSQQAVSTGGSEAPLPVAVHQAPLWGIGRTLHWEQPELATVCIDLAGDLPAAAGAQALFEEVWYADAENQILRHGAERRVARLVRHRTAASLPRNLNPHASYLVTGGVGGLGLVVARWLVAQGARNLVLAGRHGAVTPTAQDAIQTMEESGANVSVVQADIADADAVQRLLETCQTLGPLCGIVHAAGVIDDALLSQQTATRLARVMAPKISGTWHLHTQTRNLALDFFVCFSSVSSLLGNRGQSNYAAANAFMDALAFLRHQEGIPGLAINWGGWSDVGLAAELVKTTEATGLGSISPHQGVHLLGLLLTQGIPQVGVLPIQWRRFQSNIGSQGTLPILRELLAPVTPHPNALSVRQQLTRLGPEERRALVQMHLEAVLQQLVGATPAKDESFLFFGLDSLMSIQLTNRLAAMFELALPATLAFKYETIDRLTQHLLDTIEQTSGAADNAAPALPAKETQPQADWYPQLYNQRECYVWHEVVENKACLHVQQSIHILSPVDSERLAAAMQVLVDRHEALRTVYTRRGVELLQRTLPTGTVDFAASSVADPPWESQIEPILAAARAPFNLEEGPILRGRLFSRADNDHLFLLVVHHIGADATALGIIINELWTIYGMLGNARPMALPAIKRSWRDFVRRQQELLQGAEGERLWHYWQQQMAGELPSRLNLPTDFPRPEQDSHRAQPYSFEIAAPLIQQLRQFAQREGCTLYMVLMTGFQLLLHRYTRQRDLLVAAHIANRTDSTFAEVVGYLADTFALRLQIPEDATFCSVLHQVQPTILAAMDHQGYPMRLLAERLRVEEDPSRPALCQVWFTLLPLRLFQESSALFQVGAEPIQRGGLTLAATDLLPAWLGAWYDLEMILTEGNTTVFGTLVYKTELFMAATIVQMVDEFQVLLQKLVDDPDQPIILSTHGL